MSFQIELPEAVMLAEVQFDSAPGGRGNAGLGGFGGLGMTLGAGSAAGPRGGPAQGARGRGGAGRGAGGGRGRGQLRPATGPVGYTLQLSADGTTWSAPVAQGAGDTPTTISAFKPAREVHQDHADRHRKERRAVGDSAGARLRDPPPKAQSPKPKPKAQSLKPKAQSPKPKAQSPKPKRPQALGSWPWALGLESLSQYNVNV
jgi:hypothetical protein